MRKATIIILILIVLGILAGSIYYTLNPSPIQYVGDYVSTQTKESEYLLRRLYSSDIDQEKMAQLAANTLSTEFSDEDIEKAALKAGIPQFYQIFYFDTTSSTDGIEISAKFTQGLAEGQDAANYMPTNVTMEIVSADFTISDSSISANSGDIVSQSTPVISEDGSNLAAFFDGTSVSKFDLTGTSGTVMIQYKYDIKTSGKLISKTMLTDQLAIFYVTVTNADGELSVSYRADEFHLVSDVY